MYNNYRLQDIEKNLDLMGIRPLDVMVTGVTGAGKSTNLNTLFQKEVAKLEKVLNLETMELDSYSLNNYFRLWDTPDFGDGVQKRQRATLKKL